MRFWTTGCRKPHAQNMEKTTKNTQKQKPLFQNLLGELGAPSLPGVSETICFLLFCFLKVFLICFGSISFFTRFWAIAHPKCINTRGFARLPVENLVKNDTEPTQMQNTSRKPKNNKIWFQKLLGEMGAPSLPGVSETMFLCFLKFCLNLFPHHVSWGI